MRKQVLLDTNVLVLFVVGGTDLNYIGRHKNCSSFNKRDYDTLLSCLYSAARPLVTTSHILAETSNLLRQVTEPIKSDIAKFFKFYVTHSEEIFVNSADAVNDLDYPFLGLNDAAILKALRDDLVLITADDHLYAQVRRRISTALRFAELKQLD